MPDVSYGIDLSYHNGVIDWAAVRAAGYAFVLFKALDGLQSEGESPGYYQANVAQAKEAGMMVGAYQFFQPDEDSTTQAALFAQIIRTAGVALDLPPALDVEETKNTSRDMITTRVVKAITALTDWFGCPPFLYSYANFLDDFVDLTALPDCYRWIASYGDNAMPSAGVPPYEPQLPSGWSTSDIWQYSDRGAVPGISGNVDLNLAWMSRDGLKALGAGMQQKAWTGYTG